MHGQGKGAMQFIEWMTNTIRESAATLLLVTHDRAFMEECCTSILELDSGKGYVHNVGGSGSYQRFRQRRADQRAAQAAAAADAKVHACLCCIVSSPAFAVSALYCYFLLLFLVS